MKIFSSLFAYFFLSISAIIAIPTATIATMIPPETGKKYWSAIDAGGCVGSGVAAGAALAWKDVSADDE